MLFPAGILSAVVDAALVARRKLWDRVIHAEPADGGWFLPIPARDVAAWMDELGGNLKAARVGNGIDAQALCVHGLVADAGESSRAHVRLLRTHDLSRALLRSELADLGSSDLEKLRADLAYFTWRSIRREYGVTAAADVTPAFRRLARQLKDWVREEKTENQPANRDLLRFIRESPSLRAHREGDEKDRSKELALFLDTCFSLEDIDRGPPKPGIGIRDEWLDAEFLVSRLIGFRTGVSGFDMLFEGGISFADSGPGRTSLIRGSFGCAKSILSLMLCGEAARKGGVATIVALDDTVDTLEAYLTAFGIAQELQGAEGGTLQMVHSPDLKRDLATLSEQVLQHIPPRNRDGRPNLVVIDPVNSLLDLPSDPGQARDLTGKLIEKARDRGANLILVAEDVGGAQRAPHKDTRAVLDELPFMVDTVIELSHDRVHGYDQRFIQVSKSRFQRERRGLHPLAIRPGRGVVVFPSSTAFISEIAQDAYDVRSIHRPRESPDDEDLVFGFRDFGRLVGGLKQGDTLVFRGPQGGSKTLLALDFLTDPRDPQPGSGVKRRSLFLTDRSHRPLKAYYQAYGLSQQKAKDIVTLEPFPSRYVQPGRLLLDIQSHFRKAREQGVVYDRVVFANAGRWDLNCPFVRSDPGFGDALLALFERENASVIFVCAERETERDSALQRLLVDRATVVVDFERVEFGGTRRVLCRVTQTRSEPGSPNWHEVSSHGGVLRISPSLLRLEETAPGHAPIAYEVKTRLHVFQDGADSVQETYTHSIQKRIESLLMTEIALEPMDGTTLTQVAELGSLSVASDLHIVQIDEYQMPGLKQGGMLYLAHREVLELSASNRVRRLGGAENEPSVPEARAGDRSRRRMDFTNLPKAMQTMISAQDGRHIVAVPYYGNVGLLAVRLPADNAKSSEENAKRDERLSRSDLESWEGLKAAAVRPRAELFFDLSARNDQNHLCLFLEMVLGLGTGTLPPESGGLAALIDWIQEDYFAAALDCFQVLCRPGPQTSAGERGALVSRQWYASLQVLTGKYPKESYNIFPLPGGMSISGEWYLGVWARSAVPEVGFRIIMDELTTAGAELERFQKGVGLPVSRRFYDRQDFTECFPPNMTLDRSLNLGEVVEMSRCRSQIYKYDQFGPILAKYLHELLRTTPAGVKLVREKLISNVRDVLE